MVAVRRDTGAKERISWDQVSTRVPEILDDIQRNLYEKALAFRKAKTHKASTFEEMKAIFQKENVFVEAYFAGGREEEKEIKEHTGGATIRCFPANEKGNTGTCFYTGKENGRLAIFAKAY